MEHFARRMARQARDLKLTTDTVAEADAATLREFVEVALEELLALGLLEGSQPIGCWARPRQQSN